MGFVNSLPGPVVSMVIQSQADTLDAYNNITAKAWSTADTVNGKLQLGSMAQNIVSEKFKAQVDAIAFIDPADLSITVTDNHRISAGGKYYQILYVDNIENVSVELPLKLWEA